MILDLPELVQLADAGDRLHLHAGPEGWLGAVSVALDVHQVRTLAAALYGWLGTRAGAGSLCLCGHEDPHGTTGTGSGPCTRPACGCLVLRPAALIAVARSALTASVPTGTDPSLS